MEMCTVTHFSEVQKCFWVFDLGAGFMLFLGQVLIGGRTKDDKCSQSV
jgi:hypothetical protein